MATFLLANRRTGEFLGAIEGETLDDALDAYARTQGFDSFEAYRVALKCPPGEFVAVEWEPPAPPPGAA